MQRAINSNNIALPQHLLQIRHPATPNLLLLLGRKRLVIVVQQLLAVERCQPTQDSLADTADSNSADDLALEVELVLGRLGHVPPALLDHLVGGDEVADEHQDGHDDVLCYRDDVGPRHLGDRDAAVGLVGRVEVDMVGPDARCDGELEVLGFGEALGCQVARVEAGYGGRRVSCQWSIVRGKAGPNSRSGNDNLGINKLLIKGRRLALLIRSSNQSMSLILEPLANTKLVLGCAKKLWNLWSK